MASARKLPSGRWNVRLSVGVDKSGKRIVKSFTADTKREAERKAAIYMTKHRTPGENATVAEAVHQYIELKEPILSPATIRGYKSLERTAYGSIANERVSNLNNVKIQRWVSIYSKDHSPKRVKNAYGFLMSTIKMVKEDFTCHVTLPTNYKPQTYLPTEADVARLIQYIADSNTDSTELYAAVMLAAYGCMRRAEICALTEDDIDRENNLVNIDKAMILTEDHQWIIKPPKTPGSIRVVPMPPEVIKAVPVVGHGERCIKATPDQISHRFQRAIVASKLPPFRFHDLRHYGASMLHALGLPDAMTMARGGWVSPYVYRRTYRGAISEEAQRYNDMVNEKLSKQLENTLPFGVKRR